MGNSTAPRQRQDLADSKSAIRQVENLRYNAASASPTLSWRKFLNPNMPRQRKEELEARLTALLLGELPAEEAAALRELIARDV